jgi:Fe-S-cluster containining protein
MKGLQDMTNPREGKTHEALVSAWQKNAEKHDDENYQFLRRLKQRSSPTKVDRIALELHQEAFSIVDCTKCANCCRTLRIVVTDEDVPRIARHLNMAVEEFVAAYLERDEEEGCYRIKTTPCPFLGADNLCTIYDVRPEKCRGYPFTDQPDFVFRTISHANNAVVCPAVFYMIEQMKKRLGR